MKVLITGAEGFVGRNLQAFLLRQPDCRVLGYDVSSDPTTLPKLLNECDSIVHLAGVNRPKDPKEFVEGNLGVTAQIAEILEGACLAKPLVFASSIQADLDNDYGRSKRAAEERLREYSRKTGATVRAFRFANVFGKWCRPNYNSAVATFCSNIANDLPITVNDPNAQLRLVYIDDVVAAIVRELHDSGGEEPFAFAEAEPVYTTTVGYVADSIREIKESRLNGHLLDFADPFLKKLNSTFLSYLKPEAWPRMAETKRDERGWLFELVKSPHSGQIFVSTTKPGKVRGNHYHDTKVEKFCVVRGQARISLRHINGVERFDFDVSDEEVQIIDIPPGYTHSIVNTGNADCVTIFWANEIFDQKRPDTYFQEV